MIPRSCATSTSLRTSSASGGEFALRDVAGRLGARTAGDEDMTPIHYTIIPVRPEAHLYRVTCTVDDPDPSGQRFALPAWVPGSYMIRDFARQVCLSSFSRATGRLRLAAPMETT